METSAKTAFNVEQAFINTAEKIHENILSGAIDISNESHGIKVGMAATTNLASEKKKGANAKAGGGCC